MGTKQVVLVTGASSGIGYVTAQQLAQAGYEVYGTSRRPHLVNDASFHLIELDVTDEESVRRCVEYIQRSAGKIDVLVNNVGSLIFGSAEETPLTETINELELNFLGAVRMSRAIIPMMRKQGSGKIVNISSLAGLVALPFNSASSAGKFALEGYSEALRIELLKFGIFVSLIESTGTKSDGRSRSMRAVGALDVYDQDRQNAYTQMVADMESSSVSKQQVADTVLHIIRQHRPLLRYAVGIQSRLIPFLKFIFPQRIFERLIQLRMGF